MRIAIVDDDPIVCQSLETILTATGTADVETLEAIYADVLNPQATPPVTPTPEPTPEPTPMPEPTSTPEAEKTSNHNA